MTTHSHWCLVAVAREWSLFEQVERESLEKLADLPPPSAFDEMITWTKQGILWKFPVDNEQGTTASKLQSPTSHKGSMFISKNYLSGRTSSTNNVYLQIQTETNLSHPKIYCDFYNCCLCFVLMVLYGFITFQHSAFPNSPFSNVVYVSEKYFLNED